MEQIRQLYRSAPGHHHDHIELSDDGFKGVHFTDDFVKKVFKGELKDGEIYPEYYFNVADKLAQAVVKGMNGDSFKATDYRNTLKAYLEHNVFAFSAAKSLEAMEQCKSKLTDKEGRVVSYGRFRDEVTVIDTEFNDNHLRTEYNTAISTAQAAEKWGHLQQYDALEYRTVGDNRVRPSHEALDGKVFKTNDPIWDSIFPPNDWNCRCTVVPAAGKKTNNPQMVNVSAVPPYFRRNAGKSQVIFTNGHPLMHKLPKSDDGGVELRAVENYNLPSAKSILKKLLLPTAPPEKTAQQAAKWFDDNATDGVMHLATKDGISIDLGDNFSRKMITSPTGERIDRSAYVHLFPEVVQNPDEIWAHFHRGKLQQTYIKYYVGKAYTAMIKDKAGKMEFETFYKNDNPEKKRVGVLKFTK